MLITDSRINLFYILESAPDLQIDLAHLGNAKQDWLMPSVRTLFAARHEKLAGSDEKLCERTALWEKTSSKISKDFTSHLKMLLGANGHDTSTAQKAVTFQLKQGDANAALGGFVKNKPKGSVFTKPAGLGLRLSKRAQFRVHNATGKEIKHIAFRLDDLKVHQFESGVVIAVLTASSFDDQLDDELLFELVHALGRYNRLVWVDHAALPHPDSVSPLSLSDIVEGLSGTAIDAAHHDRIYSHCFGKTDAVDISAIDDAAKRLAKRYTSDYEVDSSHRQTDLFTPFKNMRHALCEEGACTLISTGQSGTQIVDSYYEHAVAPVYIPILLHALHEQAALLSQLERSAAWQEDQSESGSVLRNLRDEILTFRMRMRLTRLSPVSMHNAFYVIAREAMNLPKLQEALAQDTSEITAVIHEAMERRKEKRFKWAALATAIGVSFVGSYEAIRYAIEASSNTSLTASDGVTPLALAILFSTFIGFATWRSASD